MNNSYLKKFLYYLNFFDGIYDLIYPVFTQKVCFNWINTKKKMLSNLINLFYLNFIKALLKDGYCLKRATLIFHPIFSKCMKNLQLLKKAESQNLRKWYWSQETCFTLCTPLFTLPMAPRPIHSSFLYTSFPVARYVLIFKEISDIKYFGKRNFFLSKILLKGK